MGYPSVISELLGLALFIGLVAAIHYSRVALSIRSERMAERKAQAEWVESLRENRRRRELFRSHGVPENRNPYVIPQSVLDNPVWDDPSWGSE